MSILDKIICECGDSATQHEDGHESCSMDCEGRKPGCKARTGVKAPIDTSWLDAVEIEWCQCTKSRIEVILENWRPPETYRAPFLF